MMNKLLLFLALLSFSNLLAQQPYGIQRGQRGYIPPPKFESSVYITTIDSYEELNKTLPRCVELFSLDDFEKEILKTKEMNNILIKFEAKNSIIIADLKSKNNIFKSVKNIPNVKIADINHFSAYDLAKFKKIIFTETSIKELEKRYS